MITMRRVRVEDVMIQLSNRVAEANNVLEELCKNFRDRPYRVTRIEAARTIAWAENAMDRFRAMAKANGYDPEDMCSIYSVFNKRYERFVGWAEFFR